MIKVWLLVTSFSLGGTQNVEVAESYRACVDKGTAYAQMHQRRMLAAQYRCVEVDTPDLTQI